MKLVISIKHLVPFVLMNKFPSEGARFNWLSQKPNRRQIVNACEASVQGVKSFLDITNALANVHQVICGNLYPGSRDKKRGKIFRFE